MGKQHLTCANYMSKVKLLMTEEVAMRSMHFLRGKYDFGD